MSKIAIMAVVSMLAAGGGLVGCADNNGKASTCPSSPAASARNEPTVRLVSCAGLVSMTPLPAMGVQVGNPITISGLVPKAYSNPTSSNPSVLKVTKVGPTSAVLEPEKVGTAIVRLQTAYCLGRPEQQNACSAMTVQVVPNNAHA